MRLRRLDLTRFGHFTDFSLDFGPREEGKSDLHIIFGPNEAGKTTSFEGYLDLLFGIPARSKYNFLHDYENMRVGAVLEIEGAPTELVRIKRNKNDLITPSGDLANPAVLLHALDGIDRDQYQAMFSLDDETIEAGGDDILASQGNLGELLFSAAAGLSDLGSVLETARAEVDLFYKKRARKTELADAKRALKELHDEIRELDVPASSFRRLKDERDSAQKLMEAAKTTRDGLLNEKQRVEAMIECIPLMRSLQDHEDTLANTAAYPSVPETWVDEAQDLKLKQVEAQTELRQATLRLEAEQEKRDGLKIDDTISNAADALTILLDAPKSRAQTAEEDLPKREAEKTSLEEEIADLATELKLERADDGVLSEVLLSQLEDIAGQYSDVQARLATANKEVTTAQQNLEDLTNEDAPTLDAASIDENLEQLLEDIEPERLISDQETANRELSSAETALNAALAKLVPWQGELSDLSSLSFSEREAKRAAERYDALLGKLDKAKAAQEDAEVEYDQRFARLQTLETGDAATVDDDAKHARAERDDLWAKHREDLTESSALSFENAMSKDDALQEARLGFAEKLARLKEVEVDVAAAKTTLATRTRHLEAAEAALTEEAEGTASLLDSLHLPDSFDPRDLPAWQSLLSVAQHSLLDLNAKKTATKDAQEAVTNAEARLKSALGMTDDALGLKELSNRARAKVIQITKAQTQIEAHQRALEKAQKDVQNRETGVTELSEALSEITTSWDREVAEFPPALQDLEQFRWKVSTLRSLAAKDRDKRQLERRIQAMEQDHQRFVEEIEKIAETVNEPKDAKPLVLAERLKRRLEQAETTRELYDDLTSKIEDAQETAREAQAALNAITERLTQMAEPFADVHAVENLDDLSAALKNASEADRAKKDAAELRNRIVARLGVEDVSEAQGLLADQSVLDLEARREGIDIDLQDAETDYAQKVGDLRAAKDALEKVGGDNAPAQLEEKRQTLLIDLEERAKTVLRLKLGVLAAEQALSNYRDDHRSKMLADTEAAFRTLTAGEYSELRTQSDGQHEVLLALRKRDGRSITVAEMSKGTRFQLYLALRLAGYRQYSASGTTLPFVADDIMETFDNTRTAAALGLLREISMQGQALYFTHHEHVVELAKDVCGDSAMIHEI
ncbi:AAA family ATPase [Marimonas arenosa]|uniref:AAA family ATPase n=1 Tax=Marimonas arenosa TaxID=1795305 RepID=A0AAE3WGN4_9RHOB|nr:AAA family ATPase [Marimonas arenosa]MDQ2092304.1 AAA family ATPase [Marimonas arenosa]